MNGKTTSVSRGLAVAVGLPAALTLSFAKTALALPLPNPTLAGLADNTALDLGAFDTKQTQACGGGMGITAYSRFTYDSTNHQMLFFGGGHAAAGEDDVAAFEFETLTWSPAYPPTPASEMTLANLDQVNGRWTSTNNPLPRHTYDQLIFAPNTGELVMLDSPNGRPACLATSSLPEYPGATISHYNPVAKQWSFTSNGALSPSQAAEYDPVSGVIVQVGDTELWTYDPVSRVPARRLSYSKSSMGYSNNLIYFPPNQKMYYVARGSPTTVWEVTLDRTNWSASTVEQVTGITGSIPASGETGWAYDSVNRIIGGGIQNGQFFAYDPLAKTWTSTTIQKPSSATMGPVAYHCLDYDPVDNAFIFIAWEGDPDQVWWGRTWAYRYNGRCTGATDCSTPPTCSVGSGATCSGGACVYSPASAGTACDDGNSCTGPDICDGAGACGGPGICATDGGVSDAGRGPDAPSDGGAPDAGKRDGSADASGPCVTCDAGGDGSGRGDSGASATRDIGCSTCGNGEVGEAGCGCGICKRTPGRGIGALLVLLGLCVRRRARRKPA